MTNKKRTFNLINDKNEVYTLTFLGDGRTGYFYDVSGLGYERSPEYIKIGEQYNLLEDSINMGKIAGTIFFYGKYAYQEYLKFAMFCQDKNLTMYYRTPAGEYYRDGNISKIEKQENGDPLKVRVQFDATSLWYQTKEWNSPNVAGTPIVNVYSDSAIDCPCDIQIYNLSFNNNNISWTHNWSANSFDYMDLELISSGKLNNISLSQNQVLHIRTDVSPYRIYTYNTSTNAEVNLYSKSDFTTNRFFYLKKGYNVFSCNWGTTAKMRVIGKKYYETV